MEINFECLCNTQWGQNLYLCGGIPELGNFDANKAIKLTCNDLNRWQTKIIVSNVSDFNYYYFIIADKTIINEISQQREFKISANQKLNTLSINDIWRPVGNVEYAWNATTFTKAIFRRDKKVGRYNSLANKVEINVLCPRVLPGQLVAIVGNCFELGNWDPQKAIPMSDYSYPNWKITFDIINLPSVIQYKYIIINSVDKSTVLWEDGDNRLVNLTSKNTDAIIVNDNIFRYPDKNLKGAGVSIPVFSIRTKSSFGVGDFTNLKLVFDWACKTGLKMVQVLPVNDTISTNTFLDSYPYKSISVFALHPIYLNIFEAGTISNLQIVDKYKKLQKQYNSLDTIDYVNVLKSKLEYLQILFDENYDKTFESAGFKSFFAQNKNWLEPYAVFSYLRDLNGTSDFNKWKKHQVFNLDEITKLLSTSNKDYKKISFWFYVQYLLHIQLKDACEYGLKKNIALKGDIPIGISRTSADAWHQPHLFNFTGQAGAPPDDFSADGQNWGFPTYNWKVMATDNYSWWRNRLTKMAEYFDAYRIDHILGFFRIWEIPEHAVQGILGHFNPSYSITLNELATKNIWFDFDRHCMPYIREHMLIDMFGNLTQVVKQKYLDEYTSGCYKLKPTFDTQRKIYNNLVGDNGPESLVNGDLVVYNGLMRLAAEVIFLPSNINNQEYYPRISMHSTYSYRELDNYQKQKLDELYIDYFYHRHESFWKEQAIEKLPALVNATNMLICGEDLGMIPASVPEVMDIFGILSLEIQRMPKNPKIKFSHPANTPYMSVCTTSTHDMSTIRGWWEENRELTQLFFNSELKQWGEAPAFAEPWVCKLIIEQHLHSNSMWVVLPLQDLLALDLKLRLQNPHNERINEPANVRHYWRYRLHLNIEDLLKAEEFNSQIKIMIKNSGRLI